MALSAIQLSLVKVMIIYNLIAFVFKPIKWVLRYARFKKILAENAIILGVQGNLENLETLAMVFTEREYAAYFPFYEEVTIVDVGSHRGYFSIFASRHTAKNSRIWAVEPDADNLFFLRKNLQQNQTNNVEVVAAALHTGNEIVKLYRSQSVNHSIVLGNRDTGIQSCVEVEGITLRQLMMLYGIEKVNFLKLDCEGAEYEILFQMDKETLGRIHVVSMEFHDLKRVEYTADRLETFFTDNGFDVLVNKFNSSHRNLNYGRMVARNRHFIKQPNLSIR